MQVNMRADYHSPLHMNVSVIPLPPAEGDAVRAAHVAWKRMRPGGLRLPLSQDGVGVWVPGKSPLTLVLTLLRNPKLQQLCNNIPVAHAAMH